MPTSVQDPRLAELLDELRNGRAALGDALATVPDAERRTRPAPGRWSAAEVVEHLVMVETRIAGLLAAQLAGAPVRADAAVPDASACQIDRALLRDRTRTIDAPAPVMPSGALDPDDGWTQLGRVRAELETTVRAADGRALDAVSLPHPFLGSLNLYQWIDFIGGHEARHTAQLREVGASLPRA